MARNELAAIFYTPTPLDKGFKQISGLCKNRDHNPRKDGIGQCETRPRTGIHHLQQNYTAQDSSKNTACCAGKSLVRAYCGGQSWPAYPPSHKISSNVADCDDKPKAEYKVMSAILSQQVAAGQDTKDQQTNKDGSCKVPGYGANRQSNHATKCQRGRKKWTACQHLQMHEQRRRQRKKREIQKQHGLQHL